MLLVGASVRETRGWAPTSSEIEGGLQDYSVNGTEEEVRALENNSSELSAILAWPSRERSANGVLRIGRASGSGDGNGDHQDKEGHSEEGHDLMTLDSGSTA